MKFKFFDTKISKLLVGKRSKFENNVGTFERLYCKNEFKNIGFLNEIVQINKNFTKHAGTLRGLHFQFHPFAEEKIITCLKGSVYDVALDIRKDSQLFCNGIAKYYQSLTQSACTYQRFCSRVSNFGR